MRIQMAKIAVLSLFWALAPLAMADTVLSNCGFTGETLRGLDGIGGTRITCNRGASSEDETLTLPLSEKLGTFSNIKLRVMLDSEGAKPTVQTLATIEVKDADAAITDSGSALYYGGVCILQKKLNPDSYENCRIDMLSRQLDGLKTLLKSARLLPTTQGPDSSALLAALASGKIQGAKVLGIWIIFDSSDESL